ncbi:MAG: hypothetical protein HZA68_07825 [Rhodovulum sp.]|nr:hypothetical protein [Rhodovulum sp.]
MPEAADLLAAFWSLVWDRPIGFGGYGGIPFSAIARYAAALGVVGDELWAFERAIRAADGEWLRWTNAKDGKPHNVASRPMSPELFDAVFG